MLRTLRSFLTTACLAAALVLTGCEQDPLSAVSEDAPARLASPTPASLGAGADGQGAGAALKDRYVVVFNEGAGPARAAAEALASRHGGTVGFVYENALRGFSVTLPAAAAEALSRNPNVAYVEPDRVVTAVETQTNAPWGLDRIDQRSNTLDDAYSYASTGAGVTAYILDTGIRLSHNDFGGRATAGFDAIGDGQNGNDCHGHGTHVASTVGGTTYGVAKDVDLVAVRVLDCGGSGSTSGVVAGIDWVTANAQGASVANMSLGGGASSAIDQAVANSIASGVSYAVAAGNGDWLGREANACNYSPARVPEAITIGATDASDTKASWSNYGSCVDFFAPGVSITAAWYTGDNVVNTISGTSMATPHVAGAAARFLQGSPGASPQQVRDALYDATTKNVVADARTTDNHLLYAAPDGTTPPPPSNTAPVASFSFSCTELACSFDGSGSSDADGDALSYSWSFGDGGSASGATASHTYAAEGSYTVTLTVSDGAASDSDAQSVTVTSGGTTTFELSANGFKQKGRHTIDLSWSGAASGSVDVYRDGSVIAAGTANDGAYRDATGNRGGGSYTYQVCEAGSSVCSNTTTVNF